MVSKKRKSHINKEIIILLIFLIYVQFVPIVFNNYYSVMKSIIVFLFGILVFLSVNKFKQLLYFSFTKIFLISIVYTFALTIINITILNGKYDSPLMELLVAFLITLVSYNFELKLFEFKKALIFYAVCSVVLGTVIIFYYGSGYVVSNIYNIPSKNQIGPLISSGLIIIVYFLLFQSKSNIHSLLLIFLIVLSMANILVIRNRASILGIFLITVFLMLIKLKKNSMKALLIFITCSIFMSIAFVSGILDGLMTFAWNSISLNYEVSDINSLSAGRTDGYVKAMKYSLNNYFFGEFGSADKLYFTPHNYILNKWVSFGIFVSVPIILIYLYLFFFTCRESMNDSGVYKIGIILLAFSLIISFFEYTYPFGPGTSQFILWFSIGQYLRHKAERISSKRKSAY